MINKSPVSTNNLTEMSIEIYSNNFGVGWWTHEDEKLEGKERATLIASKLALVHSEVSEALEGMRKNPNLVYPENRANNVTYEYPRQARGSAKNYPARLNREAHARSVLEKINNLEQNLQNLRTSSGIDEDKEGFYIQVDGESSTLNEEGKTEEFKLKLKSLEPSSSYDLVSYTKLPDGTERAVVFVKEGKPKNFKIIKEVANEWTQYNPYNKRR